VADYRTLLAGLSLIIGLVLLILTLRAAVWSRRKPAHGARITLLYGILFVGAALLLGRSSLRAEEATPFVPTPKSAAVQPQASATQSGQTEATPHSVESPLQRDQGSPAAQTSERTTASPRSVESPLQRDQGSPAAQTSERTTASLHPLDSLPRLETGLLMPQTSERAEKVQHGAPVTQWHRADSSSEDRTYHRLSHAFDSVEDFFSKFGSPAPAYRPRQIEAKKDPPPRHDSTHTSISALIGSHDY
jgi:hypothetical protein